MRWPFRLVLTDRSGDSFYTVQKAYQKHSLDNIKLMHLCHPHGNGY